MEPKKSKLLYTNIIPIGSYHINNDLMKSVDLNKSISEKIKCNFDDILIGKIENSIQLELNKRKISITNNV